MDERQESTNGPGNVGGQTAAPEQQELSFDAPVAGPDGYATWQEHRRSAMAEAGRRLGLPLGHRVHVELTDGCRLTGVLRLADEGLFLDVTRDAGDGPMLRMERCTFSMKDIASCVREG